MATDGNALPSLDAAPLKFDAHHDSKPAAMSCAMCSQPIQSVYYEASGSVVCARCRGKLESSLGSAGKGGRVLRASAFGALAAVAGSIVYYAIRAATGYEIGIVAILVGWGVGRAVFLGSGKRGGRGYQVLAVGLTYMAMATTYVPAAREAVMDKKAAENTAAAPLDSTAIPVDMSGAWVDPSAASSDSSVAAAAAKPATAKKHGVGGALLGVGALLALTVVLPVLVGLGSPISILILVFGLLQAWRMNKVVALSVSGPYRLAPTASLATES